MDFHFSEDQTMLRDLARGIFEKEVTLERLRETERDADWFDDALWSQLAESHLLGVAVPEEFGGTDFGFLELCVLLQEIGRAVAPVPVLPSLVLGGLPLARFGTRAQKQRWLPRIASGEAILTAALVDAGSADPERPAARARRDGASWVLEGEKCFVPALHRAERVLVPAVCEEGVGLFLVDPGASGVAQTRHRVSTGEPLSSLRLSGVRVGAD
jgi:alkylation response protein AidB-like acyl-CoA dehydrogenase